MSLKVLYWFPRVLVILAVIFMMLFSLDEFGGSEPIGQQLLGFLAHNIPAFILIVTLVIAWKYEIIGGVVFVLLSAAMTIFFKSFSGNPASLIVISPFVIAGLMFMLHKLLSDNKQALT
jgi:hypothetical protein